MATDYLLDTCTALWWMAGSDNIPPDVTAELADPAGRVLLSDVSVLEMVIKFRLGKLGFKKKPSVLLPNLAKRHGFERLRLGTRAIFQLESMPMHHRDPFDRLLVAQAIVHRLVLVSPDAKLRKYKAPILW